MELKAERRLMVLPRKQFPFLGRNGRYCRFGELTRVHFLLSSPLVPNLVQRQEISPHAMNNIMSVEVSRRRIPDKLFCNFAGNLSSLTRDASQLNTPILLHAVLEQRSVRVTKVPSAFILVLGCVQTNRKVENIFNESSFDFEMSFRRAWPKYLPTYLLTSLHSKYS